MGARTSSNVCSKIDLLIADLVYRVDEDLVKALNTFLLHEEAPFGGYYFVWDAAQELQRLTAKKSNKAAALKGFLGSFAQQYGFSVAAFEEWQEVMYAKNRRDHTGYPLETRTEDLTFLRGLMDKADSCIQPYKNAVFALVVAAEKMSLK
ncbi:hypothetical protein CHLRE_13g589550v5 [Chlamydomonas reinhardtii]|uniref:Uncharacterized protein n=1 Tax=Chlamydomonas reinhardtii TaxID=3055 RepID=A0A2K3D0Z5_CHLRE|nr:uncharacterized protein CHLRE_13g589550v5 [Chlamydomonas reinhardtii]PNW74208.1 hypothetical protein CHLRE_13g589550v5 [Chlamydomonas reinhardtii]